MTPFQRLSDLATCLCAQIEEDGHPVCFCGLLPGGDVSQDYGSNCKDANGMAWVRLVSAFPADGVNVPNEDPGNCGSETSMLIEVGITRLMPVGDKYGNPPLPADLLAATELQLADMLTMQRAIFCCEALPNKDFILGSYAPAGPLGQIVGGTYQVAVVA